MTWPNFIQRHDQLNTFSIDSHNIVQADSTATQNAFREVSSQLGFEQQLQDIPDWLHEVESLGRTRELTLKEIVKEGIVQIRVVEGMGDGQGGMFVNIKTVPSP
jgi:hypothetical protein